MTIKINISEADFAALPDNQRFLLEQLMVDHHATTRETAVFAPTPGDRGEDNEHMLDASRNGFGGLSKPFDPDRRFR